ncbi:lipopolysaccharide biosynthesis protein [Rhodoplanes sp. Z2-YC6860]|uniref:lipopolysaccharide biosynthesis protein n=1 Tax=Rhodoplanes sp. Z2-YC6860 TaxID=674703 RepID=UPI00078C1430|nr:polysaccharide biosynthesis C-terminal domain-containing protein [Rhodoplanes sp. Z2-YC6860]AMN43611.1 polysaccharide biosynthesis protein [Rhodoplanes sp. Z2-YC6860]
MALHALIYGVAFLVPAVLGFGTFVTLTHLLDSAQYAIYSTGNSFAFFAGSFFFSWVRFSAGRYEAERGGPIAIRFWMSCYLFTLPVAAAALSLTVFLKLITPGVALGVFLVASGQALFDLAQEFYRARHRSRPFAAFNVVRSTISIVLALAIAFTFPSGAVLLSSLGFSFFLCALINVWKQARNGIETDHEYSVREILVYGGALAVSGLVFSAGSVLSRLIVASMLGVATAGPYNAAADLASQIGGMIGISIYSIAGPTVIKNFASSGIDRARAEFRKAGEMFLAVALPATVGVVLVADPLVAVVTGPHFHDVTARLLPLMIVSVAISAWNQYHLHIAFQVVSKPGLQVLAGLLQVVSLVAFTYLLIGPFGVEGAAYAFVIASVIGSVVTLALARSIFPVSLPMAGSAKIVACTIGMALVVYVCTHSISENILKLAVGMPAGIAVYGLLALLFDVWDARRRSHTLFNLLKVRFAVR